ncbi:hypothetical protein ASPZODRAFT_1668687 [Penicilliopsis zonata CBS 506.65]|uniref:Uncharacterized protein n=1 Tax=Penicilliopsis zonata CBS 506.65 TaxID=1073090 RepID=A0A1L9S4H1_9EURO|nr:hypothetical protein ASPZODRAFT_1668687 [Penicilliopsis zonata CBS 506.65]OJJ42062.1 hypothetical protein ASPZODRAFT_1668687 [Penicilliopsis zonata CBS 506.65]
MLYLWLSLPIHDTVVFYLDEYTRADLVNRFGGKVRRLFLLPLQQRSVVLGGCKKGGHIRWHQLATEEEVLSSDFRDGCLNIHVVSVGIEDPGAGVLAMSATDLRKFTHDFGVDLDEIRKLGKEEMECLFGWLRDAGMLDYSDVLLNQVPAYINLPEALAQIPLMTRTPVTKSIAHSTPS